MTAFDIVFWVALALAVLFLIAAVAFFIKDRIWEVIAYFSGVRTGMRATNHVRMTATPKAQPKKEKRTWKQGENIRGSGRGEEATAFLGEEQATVPMRSEAETVLLNQQEKGKGTAVISEEVPAPESEIGDGFPTYQTAGSITLDEEMRPEGGTVILDGAESAPQSEGGTVILSGSADETSFRIVEKILLVFTDEVIS